MAWVPQSPTIIAGTIADNIRLGDPTRPRDRGARRGRRRPGPPGFVDAPARRLRHACSASDGLRLSGGQRQRLAIARAALRDAPVVVLDEFTAHLDDDLEAEVLAAIAELLRGRTALVIAHRAATAAMADRVVRLEPGACRRARCR